MEGFKDTLPIVCNSFEILTVYQGRVFAEYKVYKKHIIKWHCKVSWTQVDFSPLEGDEVDSRHPVDWWKVSTLYRCMRFVVAICYVRVPTVGRFDCNVHTARLRYSVVLSEHEESSCRTSQTSHLVSPLCRWEITWFKIQYVRHQTILETSLILIYID